MFCLLLSYAESLFLDLQMIRDETMKVSNEDLDLIRR